MNGLAARLRALHEDESGSALVEFVVLAIVFLVPLAYLMMALFAIQSAAFAAEGAARDAGRVYAAAVDEASARGAADLTVAMAFEDFGLNLSGPASVEIECDADPCLTPGAVIRVTVSAGVRLPLLPDALGTAGTLPVEGTAAVVVDRYRDR